MTGAKVLVVDDSWTDLTLMASPLRENGFEVITAVDGEEAVEKALQEQPQCILLDIVLPNKQSGFQVCRKLKSMEQTYRIPIILVSGKNTELDVKWGMQQGANMYIFKPFTREELLSSVRSLTGVH